VAARRLRSAEDLVGPAVAEALEALDLRPEDVGIRRLALRYAAQIDEAARIAADFAEAAPDGLPPDVERIRTWAAKQGPHAAPLVEAVDRIEDMLAALGPLRKRVQAQAVLSDLGPKLLAALAELGASPRARHALKGGVVGGAKAGGRLAALRGA
jgi:hypothetical protein